MKEVLKPGAEAVVKLNEQENKILFNFNRVN